VQPTLSRRYRLAESAATDEESQPGDGALDVDLRAIASALPERIDATPEGVEQGLAKLVLTIIEVLRKVLEHQAVRRMDGGTLSDAEVERLGLALLSLDGRLRELKTVFGLSDEELEIDLGPLGRLR
jgi:actin-like ATPase involved in cell morphogenesis